MESKILILSICIIFLEKIFKKVPGYCTEDQLIYNIQTIVYTSPTICKTITTYMDQLIYKTITVSLRNKFNISIIIISRSHNYFTRNLSINFPMS